MRHSWGRRFSPRNTAVSALYATIDAGYLLKLDRKTAAQRVPGAALFHVSQDIGKRSCVPIGAVSGTTQGGVPKRSNGADCKSAGIAFGGSNPPPTI